MEPLEHRRMLAGTPLPVPPGIPGAVPLTPAQVAAAYGVNDINFGSTKGNGAGQTIAIVDAGDDPEFVSTGSSNFAASDLATFDFNEGLPNPPSFEVVGQTGGAVPTYPSIQSITEVGTTVTVTTTAPEGFIAGDVIELDDTTTNPNYQGFEFAIDPGGIISPTQFSFTAPAGLGVSAGGQIVNPADEGSGETAMDVEWAHAMAPGANIVLIEMNSLAFYADLPQTLDTATAFGASVVSMSFGAPESDLPPGDEQMEDALLASHSGISYVVSTGDTGEPGAYAALSPDVLAAGATNLSINPNGSYLSETGWSNPPAIISITESGTTATVTTATPSGIAVGNAAWISGVGVPGYNSTTAFNPFTVTSVLSDTSFTVTAPAGLPASGPVAIAANGASEDAFGTVTITTVGPYNLSPGDIVDIDGVGAGYDGNVQITGTPSPTTFTYEADETGLAPSGGGTVSGIVFGDLSAGPTGTNVGGTGGGASQFEIQPAYQSGVVPASMSDVGGTAMRTVPDVSFVGGSDTPVITYDSYPSLNNLEFPAYPYNLGGGTSLAAPCWAGLIAIIDQGRALQGRPPLSTSDPTNGLQAVLYQMPASDYHDITVGYNGFDAGTGYDLVTGLGTPVANRLIPNVVAYGLPQISPAQTTAKADFGGGLLRYAVTPTISEQGKGASAVDDLQLTVDSGTLTVPLAATGVKIVAGSNNSGSVTVQGTLQQLDAAIQDVTDTPNGISGATLRLTPIDPTGGIRGGAISGLTAIVTITVSVPPVAQNLFTHTNENTPLTIDLTALVTSSTDPLDPSTFRIVSQLGNGNIDQTAIKTGKITYTPDDGFIGGDTFTYDVRSTAGLLSDIATVWIVVGPTGSLSGYSYVDLNNNGVKDPGEVGIDGVSVTVTKTDGTFTFSQTVQTQADGSYVLGNLPAGQYTITETEPAFFEHGQDTAGTPAPAAPAAVSGQFANITLTGDDTNTESGTGYNFGELGLRAEFALAYLTRRAFFASSESTLTGFNATTGDVWVSFDSGIDGTLNAAATASGGGNVSLTLFNNNLQPLVTTVTSNTAVQLTYQGTAGQPYFLEVAGTSPNASLQTSIANTNLHNSANPDDVDGDGSVTPLDALAVINLLNELGPGPLAGKQVPLGIMPDVLGNGSLSPQDALQIIDYLNLLPAPQPLDVAPAAAAPSATAPAAPSAALAPALASPLITTPAMATNATAPSAAIAVAGTIPPAASPAPPVATPLAVARLSRAVLNDGAEPVLAAATASSSATQPTSASSPPITSTQLFASSAAAVAPAAKPASTSPQPLDPDAVAAAMSLNKGRWDTL